VELKESINNVCRKKKKKKERKNWREKYDRGVDKCLFVMFDFRKTNKEKSLIIFGNNTNQNEKGKDRIPRELYTKKGKRCYCLFWIIP
jgi:hypothetical protein